MKSDTYKTKKELLFDLHDATFKSCKAIMVTKNADYASDGDPYSNFRTSNMFGVHPILGILLRVMDKLQRIRTYATKGKLETASEGFEDSCDDIINYMILIKGITKELEETPSRFPWQG